MDEPRDDNEGNKTYSQDDTSPRDRSDEMEIYDAHELEMGKNLTDGVENVGNEIFRTSTEILKELGETDGYFFLYLLSTFRDRLMQLCVSIGGDAEMEIPICYKPDNESHDSSITDDDNPEIPESMLMDIEAIVDDIEENALRVMKALKKEPKQYDVLALLSTFNSELKTFKETIDSDHELSANPSKLFEASSIRLSSLGLREETRNHHQIKSTRLKLAVARNFELPQVIEALKDPKNLKKDDLKDIYYFLLDQCEIPSDSTQEMADRMTEILARNSIIHIIWKNSTQRAWMRKTAFTKSDLLAIKALELMAKHLHARKKRPRKKTV